MSKLKTVNKESFWTKSEELTKVLLDQTDLMFSEINAVVEYVKKNLFTLIAQACMEQRDIYLSPCETKLPLPLEINKEGYAQLPLKKWGRNLGVGGFRKTKTAIALSHHVLSVIAHSVEKIDGDIKKKYSDSEIAILKKIAQFQDSHPEVKGILRFFSSTDYESKRKPSLAATASGYSVLASDPQMQMPALILKRTISTKLYNYGNLKERLDSLSFANRVIIAHCLFMGLRHLHLLNIFHSDLKLDNILIEWDNEQQKVLEAVIADFGFACDLSKDEDRFYKNGFKECRAPEINGPGSAIDEEILAADIFSLGLIMKELFPNVKHPILDNLLLCMTSDDPCVRPIAAQAYQSFLTFEGSYKLSCAA